MLNPKSETVMTQQEFENRTRRLITAEDYYLVENLYMAAGNMNKDEFCKEMRAMCAYDGANDHIELRQCLKEIGRRVGGLDAELGFLKKTVKEEHIELAEFLIGKASAYNDTDFYNKAVKLVGQKEVVIMKIKMGLPLWDEDMQYINNNLE
jgi:hypothetical protein|nr:MAG TPA: hypothetical protein [Caudoviricetes sp.]